MTTQTPPADQILPDGGTDEWDNPLPPPPPSHPGRRRITAGLGAAVLLVAGFLVGIQVEKRSVTPAAAATTSTGGAGTPAAAGRFARGAGGGAGGVIAGTIKVIDGSTLYVTELSGNTVAVRTQGATISITSTGGISQVHPGQSVVVRGTTARNGSVSARSVSVGLTSLFGGGGGGFGAGGGGFGAGGGGAGAATGGQAPAASPGAAKAAAG